MLPLLRLLRGGRALWSRTEVLIIVANVHSHDALRCFVLVVSSMLCFYG